MHTDETTDGRGIDHAGKWTDEMQRAYLEMTREKLLDHMLSRLVNDKRQSSFANDNNVCGE